MFLKPEPGFSELEKKLKSFSQKSAVLKEVLLEFKGEPDKSLPGKKMLPSQIPHGSPLKSGLGWSWALIPPLGLVGRAPGCLSIGSSQGKGGKGVISLGFECESVE